MAGSILDTFYVLFTSNVAELKKDAKEAKGTVADLDKALNKTSTISTQLGASFNNLIKQAAGFFVTYLSARTFAQGIKDTAQYANNLGLLSQKLGFSVKALDLWGRAVEQAGGSAEGFFGTVKTLNNALIETSIKGTSALLPYFNMLGISLVNTRGKIKSLAELLPELSDAFTRVSRQQAFTIGQQLGIDEGTILLLRKGRQGIQEILKKQKELGILTQKDAEIARKFHQQWQIIVQTFKQAFIRINSFILPILGKLFDKFEVAVKFIKNNKDVIIGALSAIGTAISVLLVKPLLRAGVAALPLALITAAVLAAAVAFGILYDDIKAFQRGADSALGELIKKYPAVGKAIEIIIYTLKGLIKTLGLVVDGLELVFSILIKQTRNAISVFSNLAKSVGAAWNFIVDKITGAVEKIKGAYDSVIGLFKKKTPDTEFMIKGGQILQTASDAELGTRLSQNIGAANRFEKPNLSLRIGDINIATQATDASGISQEIGQSLREQLRQAVSTFDDGVAA